VSEKEQDDERGVGGHFVRSIGESTRHNSLAYGYSLALTGAFGVLNLQDETTVLNVILFGLAGALPFSIANPLVTRGFSYRVEGEPPIVLSLGTSLGFVSVVSAISLAALLGWLLGGWVAWMLGGFVASGGYLVLGALELVLARAVRALLGLEHLEER
jgi:MFS family permease